MQPHYYGSLKENPFTPLRCPVKTMTMILPVPTDEELQRFHKLFPIGTAKDGDKHLAVCALENMHCCHSFVRDCFDMLAYYVENPMQGYRGIAPSEKATRVLLELCLEDFFETFTKRIKEAVGPIMITLNRVISYDLNKAVFVEVFYHEIYHPPRI